MSEQKLERCAKELEKKHVTPPPPPSFSSWGKQSWTRAPSARESRRGRKAPSSERRSSRLKRFFFVRRFSVWTDANAIHEILPNNRRFTAVFSVILPELRSDPMLAQNSPDFARFLARLTNLSFGPITWGIVRKLSFSCTA